MGNTYHAVKTHLLANLTMIDAMHISGFIENKTYYETCLSIYSQLQALEIYSQQNNF